MSLLDLIIVLVIVGVVLYCANAFIPMEASIKRILNIAVIAFLVIWLLQAFGLLDSIRGIRIGK